MTLTIITGIYDLHDGREKQTWRPYGKFWATYAWIVEKRRREGVTTYSFSCLDVSFGGDDLKGYERVHPQSPFYYYFFKITKILKI